MTIERKSEQQLAAEAYELLQALEEKHIEMWARGLVMQFGFNNGMDGNKPKLVGYRVTKVLVDTTKPEENDNPAPPQA